jgi:hypothetical protein
MDIHENDIYQLFRYDLQSIAPYNYFLTGRRRDRRAEGFFRG